MRRGLHQTAGETPKDCFERGSIERGWDLFRGRRSRGVIRVCGESETNLALVSFPGLEVELGETGGFSNRNRQDARCKRVQGTKVSHLANSQQPAHPGHDVVGRYAGSLIHHEHAGNFSIWERTIGREGVEVGSIRIQVEAFTGQADPFTLIVRSRPGRGGPALTGPS